MSLLVLASVATLATVYVASHRSGSLYASLADSLHDSLGISEADIVRDLAASFETREG